MARGIRVPFVADVSDYLRGMGKMIRGLDDVEDNLDKVGRDAKRAGDDVEESFERAGRDAEDAFKDLARDADRQFEKIESDAERTGREVREAMAESTRKQRLGEIGNEIGEELAENVGEGFRSGNPADVLFESLTSLAPALGGAGFIIGGVAGLVGGIIRGAEEASAEVQAKISELASDWFDTATEAYAGGQEAARALREGFITGTNPSESLAKVLGVDTVQDAWLTVADLVESTELPIETVEQAILGNADALSIVEQALEDNERAYEDVVDQAVENNINAADQAAAIEKWGGPLKDAEAGYKRILDYGGDSAEATDRAARAADTLAAHTRATATRQASVARDSERSASGLSNAAYSAKLLRDRMARVSTPSFTQLERTLGYAAANAWSLSAALGQVNNEADLKGIARGALMR